MGKWAEQIQCNVKIERSPDKFRNVLQTYKTLCEEVMWLNSIAIAKINYTVPQSESTAVIC